MDQMAKLMNRISAGRLVGATLGLQRVEPGPFARTRAEFVDRILGEAVAFQVENDTDSDLGPAEEDSELQLAIEEVREARDVAPLAAYALAGHLRQFLVSSGYCDEDELPTYRPRG